MGRCGSLSVRIYQYAGPKAGPPSREQPPNKFEVRSLNHEHTTPDQSFQLIRNTLLKLATSIATQNPPICNKIRAQGLRLFTDGRRIRIWPPQLCTADQSRWLEAHQTAVRGELTNLWANPTRCRDCRNNRPTGCVLRLTPSVDEGGWHSDDLHVCESYGRREDRP